MPPSVPSLPLVGQAFTVKDWSLTVLILCGCPASEMLLVPLGAARACPACNRVFTVEGVRADQSGALQFGVRVS